MGQEGLVIYPATEVQDARPAACSHERRSETRQTPHGAIIPCCPNFQKLYRMKLPMNGTGREPWLFSLGIAPRACTILNKLLLLLLLPSCPTRLAQISLKLPRLGCPSRCIRAEPPGACKSATSRHPHIKASWRRRNITSNPLWEPSLGTTAPVPTYPLRQHTRLRTPAPTPTTNASTYRAGDLQPRRRLP